MLASINVARLLKFGREISFLTRCRWKKLSAKPYTLSRNRPHVVVAWLFKSLVQVFGLSGLVKLLKASLRKVNVTVTCSLKREVKS